MAYGFLNTFLTLYSGFKVTWKIFPSVRTSSH
jgi:hypothetical protein